MGWLFGKKKMEPKVPFPEGRSLDEKTLRFPSGGSRDKIIEPEQVKAAAGVGKESFFSGNEEKEEMPLPKVPVPQFREPREIFQTRASSAPLYVKVDVYQKILGELDSMRSDIFKLQESNTHLQSSEYNEESNFAKLRKSMRGIHDDLLRSDKVLFKA